MILNKNDVKKIKEQLALSIMDNDKKMINIQSNITYKIMLCEIYEMLNQLIENQRNESNQNGKNSNNN